MSQETFNKRRRITADILSISDTNEFADQTKEESTDNTILCNVLRSKLSLLETKLETKSQLYEATLQEKEEKIKKLITELNEAKNRAVYHKENYDKAQETLSTMKTKHNSVTGELRDSLESCRSKMQDLENKLDVQQKENESLKSNLQEQQLSYTDNVSNLENIINNFKEALAENKKELENRKQQYELSLLKHTQDSNDDSKQDQMAVDSLLKQNFKLSTESNRLKSENEQLNRELKHYKSVYQDVNMLRMEKASLEYKLSDYQELLTAKISLEYENSKLKAACHATTAIKESPDLLNNVRGKKYFETKIEKYESEIDSLKTVIKDLETHLDDLKTTIEEQKLVRTAEESARNLLVKRVEAAERHARVVENQLTIYDHAEKLYLDAEKVDQLKIKRINELEELVRSLEKQLLEQTKDMAEQQVKQAIQEKPIIQVNHGPYYELTSGVRITEFLTDLFNKEKEHFEELTQLNIIKENLEMKYKAAEAQISELQKAISLRSSLTSNKMISSSIKVEPISSSTESVLLSATNNTAMDTTVEEATDDDNKKYRILELKDNPASREYAIRKELLNNLRQENHDLRQQLFTQSSTLPDSSWTNLEAEKSSLTTECETLRKRIKRMLTAYDTNIQKNMTHIKSLLGYSVFFHDSGLIRLESIWADPVDLHFMVKIDDESGHAILRITGKERDRYMAYLEDSYQMYVVHDRNIAAFLSAAALELYVEYKGEEQLKERQQKERQQQQQLEQEQVEFELQENESLEDEQQQQQQQEYLQQDRKQQEHEQDENKHEEGQEYEREDEQQELQEPQQQQQEQQHEEEVTVEEEDYEYVEDDDMPVEEDDMPVEEDDMPVEEDDMPVEEDDMPVEEDDMPVEEEYMPVEEDEYDYEEGEESYVEEEVDMPEIIENHKGPSFVVHIDDSE